MLFTEHSISLVSISFLQFHAVVASPCALDMESNSTTWCLALHTSSILLQAYDTLQVESLLIELGHPDWSLRSDHGSRDPRSTAQMYPLIERLRRMMTFKFGFVLWYEALVVFWCHSLFLMLIKLKINSLQWETCFKAVFSQFRLVVELSREDHGEAQVLVLVVTS